MDKGDQEYIDENIKDVEETRDPEWIDNPTEKISNEKGEYELELYLSTDGKHTVHFKVNDPKSRHEAVKKATELYDYILRRYGTKQAQAVKEYGNGHAVDPKICKHINVGFNQSKTEKNPGRWFKSCKDCKEFLGWQS